MCFPFRQSKIVLVHESQQGTFLSGNMFSYPRLYSLLSNAKTPATLCPFNPAIKTL